MRAVTQQSARVASKPNLGGDLHDAVEEEDNEVGATIKVESVKDGIHHFLVMSSIMMNAKEKETLSRTAGG